MKAFFTEFGISPAGEKAYALEQTHQLFVPQQNKFYLLWAVYIAIEIHDWEDHGHISKTAPIVMATPIAPKVMMVKTDPMIFIRGLTKLYPKPLNYRNEFFHGQKYMIQRCVNK